ncbi:ATP-binding protein [Streptomyces sp. NPDC090029]|uniref:ATP-binding protein n=1 Tax=Streptomyces sp. NPDC090029 TaxID=3365924 RepID=UPI0038177A37
MLHEPASPPSAPAGPPPATRRLALPHAPVAVPLARAAVRSALAAAGIPADRDTAELLTAELVANAVEHTPGGTPIELVVETLPRGCRVEVRDAGPPLPDPAPRAGALWREDGRGLVLLRALSATHGHRCTEGGKAVWFTLSARL